MFLSVLSYAAQPTTADLAPAPGQGPLKSGVKHRLVLGTPSLKV